MGTVTILQLTKTTIGLAVNQGDDCEEAWNLKDCRIVRVSPFSPTSFTLFSSGAIEVVSIRRVTPFFPSSAGGKRIVRPQIRMSPCGVFLDMPSNRNS